MKNQRDWRQQFAQAGTILLPPDVLPFTGQDWALLENGFSVHDFTQGVAGDTQEKASAAYFRIKISAAPEIYDQRLYDLLAGQKFRTFLDTLCGVPAQCFLDRCQLHDYTKGGFLEKHTDAKKYKNYVYSTVLFMRDAYQGGEFVVYGDEEVAYQPPKGSLLVTKSSIPHEVRTVLSGVRKTVLCFFERAQDGSSTE